MYLANNYEDEELGGIGRSLRKGIKGIARTVKKVARPALKLGASPAIALHRAALKSRKTRRPVAITSLPPAFQPVNQPQIVPAASVPDEDYDGTEMTQLERDVYIEDGAPAYEPYSSGYPVAEEESFGPLVPGIVQPSDLAPVPPAKKPVASLPILGGILLLLNFL